MQRLAWAAVALAVIADVEVPLAVHRIGEEESVDGPLVGRPAAMDRVARHSLKRVERGVAVHRMPQPKVHVLRFRVVDFGHGTQHGPAEANGDNQTAHHAFLHATSHGMAPSKSRRASPALVSRKSK